jgi:tetratricopeptide (TPR) repeat protein
MTGIGRCAPWLALAAALGAAPALAQSREEMAKRCTVLNAEIGIPGCTALIERGGLGDVELARAHHTRGILLALKREYRRALEDFNQTIRLNPSYAYAFHARGNIHDRLGQLDRALGDYEQALRLDPSYLNARHGRGRVLGRMGQHERAIQDYDEVIRREPADVDAHSDRCRAAAGLVRLEAALKDCAEALRRAPGDSYALESRGLLHLKAGRLDAAIADYDAALGAGEAKRATALYGRAIARQRKGDAAGAAADVAAARAIQADIADEMARYGVR